MVGGERNRLAFAFPGPHERPKLRALSQCTISQYTALVSLPVLTI